MFFKKVSFIIVSLFIVMPVWSMNYIKKDKGEVTKEIIQKHKDDFVDYVLSIQKTVIMTPNWAIKVGAWGVGYNSYSLKLIPISYDFFRNKKKKITKEVNRVICDNLKEEDLEYINDGIDKYNKKDKKDKNTLPFILHIKHVQSLTLPKGVTKQSLIDDPELLVGLINNGKIKRNEYKHAMVLNLLIRFLKEKKEVSKTDLK